VKVENRAEGNGRHPEPDVASSTDSYAARFAGPVGSWFLDVQAQAVIRFLGAWPEATVLDVGGGHGQLAGPLARNGYRVTVLGSDPSCVHRIEELVGEGACSFVTGSLLRLPFADKSFDVVTAFRLMAHVDDWRAFVAELSRVSRRAVVVDFASSRSLNLLTPLFFRLKHRLEGNTRPYALLQEGDILREFASHGLGRSRRFAQFFFPMVVHRTLGSRSASAAMEAPFRLLGLTGLLGSPVILSAESGTPPHG
jgi:SAM-dependent methyltransferase